MSKSNGKTDPAALREKAKQLLEQAEQIEREAFVRIGKLTMKHYDSGFESFDIKQFKKEIEGVL